MISNNNKHYEICVVSIQNCCYQFRKSMAWVNFVLMYKSLDQVKLSPSFVYPIYGLSYSRMDQVKFVKVSL